MWQTGNEAVGILEVISSTPHDGLRCAVRNSTLFFIYLSCGGPFSSFLRATDLFIDVYNDNLNESKPSRVREGPGYSNPGERQRHVYFNRSLKKSGATQIKSSQDLNITKYDKKGLEQQGWSAQGCPFETERLRGEQGNLIVR